MDLVRLQSLSAYWLKNPPVHVAFARFVGWKTEASAEAHLEPVAAAQSAGAILDSLIQE